LKNDKQVTKNEFESAGKKETRADKKDNVADKKKGKLADKKEVKTADKKEAADKKTSVVKYTSKKSGPEKSPVVSSKSSNPNRLTVVDFDKPCEDLARYFIGKLLVSQVGSGNRVSGRITETEAYLGGEDKASDSFGGRKTKRNAAMYMVPGMSSIYSVYGMYTCINISSRGLPY